MTDDWYLAKEINNLEGINDGTRIITENGSFVRINGKWYANKPVSLNTNQKAICI